MEIVQIPLSKMAVFAYLAGDPETRSCVIIDPACDAERILNAVQSRNWSVCGVINTHCHPDHTAANKAIIQATRAPLSIHTLDAKGLEAWTTRLFSLALGGRFSPAPDQLLNDGDTLCVGSKHLSVIHTPGHTRGGICLYSPGHLITGDTLFVGSIGRTDLSGGSLKQLRESIHQKIYTLPEHTIVWPGHHYGPAPYSTVGREKTMNPFT